MHYIAFMIALLCAPQAQAAATRCGTDAFGNSVCMDEHGVVTAAPARRAGVATRNGAASAVSAGRSGKTGRDDQERGVRCGTDPFGNTVCADTSAQPKE